MHLRGEQGRCPVPHPGVLTGHLQADRPCNWDQASTVPARAVAAASSCGARPVCSATQSATPLSSRTQTAISSTTGRGAAVGSPAANTFRNGPRTARARSRVSGGAAYPGSGVPWISR
ncbi:hypothetical protein Srufu_001980 [Streptomyces libani subsp. rufus]|nr:hypothetical protein Srufu_001980 [Streptomyces libani subsp. rufus]